MKIVYYDCRGLPLPAIVAAIRTGRLPRESLKPTDLFNLPLIYCKKAFAPYGVDERGNEVYALWCRAEQRLLPRFFQARRKLYREKTRWVLQPVNGIPGAPLTMLAWRLARLGCPIGKNLFYRNILKRYTDLLALALHGLDRAKINSIYAGRRE